jgi:hypothetical protein
LGNRNSGEISDLSNGAVLPRHHLSKRIDLFLQKGILLSQGGNGVAKIQDVLRERTRFAVAGIRAPSQSAGGENKS